MTSTAPSRPASVVVNHVELLAKAMVNLEDPCIARGEIELESETTQIELAYIGRSEVSTTSSNTSDSEINSRKFSFPCDFSSGRSLEKREQLESLLTACDGSPFGHGSNTVYDETVRKAKQIPPERIQTINFDVVVSGILERVRKNLVPHAGDIDAALHKLNVYGPGDHFRTHQDTPRDRHCFGTLIVCLPSEFTGGQLDIEGSTFDFGDMMRKAQGIVPNATASKTIVPWVAFFGDCKHSIAPVEDGYRITLTYILRHVNGAVTTSVPTSSTSSSSSSSSSSASSSSSSKAIAATPASTRPSYGSMSVKQLKEACKEKGVPVSGTKAVLIARLTNSSAGSAGGSSSTGTTLSPLPVFPCLDDETATKGKSMFDTLRTALLDPEFFSSGSLLAFPCVHLYEHDNELPPQDNCGMVDVVGSNLRLKGADAFLYIAAARLGLKPRVVRIGSCEYIDEEIFLHSWPSLEDARNWASLEIVDGYPGRTMTEDSFNNQAVELEFEGREDEGENSYSDTDIDWVEYPRTTASGSDKVFAMQTRVLECSYSAEGYFGNEGCDSTFYAKAAVILQIPSASLRKDPAGGAAATTTTTSTTSTTAAVAAVAVPSITAINAETASHVAEEEEKLGPADNEPRKKAKTASAAAAAGKDASVNKENGLAGDNSNSAEPPVVDKDQKQVVVLEQDQKEEEEEEEEGEVLEIPKTVDVSCFQGIKKGLSSHEESKWANDRFRAFAARSYTRTELQQLAMNLCINPTGTMKQLTDRINREMNRQQRMEMAELENCGFW